MSDLARRRRRLEGARFLIRAELVIAVAAPLVIAILVAAAPGTLGGGMRQPSLLERFLPWAGVMGWILGLVWMIRLSRPEPEGGERTWRYRDLIVSRRLTASGKRLRSRRRWLLLLAVLAVVGLSVFTVAVGCSATTGFGGTSCWWDGVPWGIRGFVRATWVTVTGQPETQDLFPF